MNRQRIRQEKGITLIALIITIVVLLILAVVAIRAVTGDGIIAKALQAREDYEMAQIKEEAELVKAEAIMEYNILGKDLTQSDLVNLIKEHFEGSTKSGNTVITENGKYKIKVDSNLNITVEKSGTGSETAELNEYGFYFDQLYVAELPEGAYFSKAGYVFHEDGTAEAYASNKEEWGCDDLFCVEVIESGITYSDDGTIIITNEDGTQSVATISEDGLSATMDGITATCTFQEIHGIYRNTTYSSTVTVVEPSLQLTFIIDENDVCLCEIVGADPSEGLLDNSTVILYGKEHILLSDDGERFGVCG